ncbi:MAG: hypothetical protein ACR652_24630 [Methylocystis sp.]|uniref:hypothetical protein n=1 Tax=Methylocystis sp. TaxID=1911079 RepID=UPI003DA5C348
MSEQHVKDRAGSEKIFGKRGEFLGYRFINPARRAKKATGLKGRQWVKHRKATRRAERVAAKLAEMRAYAKEHGLDEFAA